MKRSTIALATLLCVIASASACQRQRPGAVAAAATPPDPCAAALAPGPERTERDRVIARAQEDARGNGSARGALERLGYLYVARARAANDPGDYTLAQVTAACLDARYPGDAAILLLKGHVLHQLHRFRDAEQIGRTLVARRTVALDYGLLGDALMEQGRWVVQCRRRSRPDRDRGRVWPLIRRLDARPGFRARVAPACSVAVVAAGACWVVVRTLF